MKRCPGCGYSNPGLPAACAVCGADLSRSPDLPDRKPSEKKPGLLVSAGIVFLLFGAYQYFPHRPSASAVKAVPQAEEPDYSGVLYSLEKMSALKFLPDADKLAVLPLLNSPDEKVGHAAARAAGAWIRSGAAGETEKRLFEGLLGAASSAVPAVRRQAALEAALASASGFPAGPYSSRLDGAARALADGKDPELMGAGFFLSAMAGSRDLVPEMRGVISAGEPAAAVLYAACSLSRLNDPEGNARMEELASGPCSGRRAEALGCLAYSASPRAAGLLAAAAAEPASGECAESARMALILREQLAIIKK